jgi:hypothetical protein
MARDPASECDFGEKSYKRRRGRLLIWAVAITVLICSGAMLYGVRAYNRAALATPTAPAATWPAVETQPPPPAGTTHHLADEKPEVSVITLFPQGFHPREITKDQGHLILIVSNNTGLGDVSLNLDKQAGNRLRAARVDSGRPYWGDVFDLPAGVYTLSEESHPEWVCTITINR